MELRELVNWLKAKTEQLLNYVYKCMYTNQQIDNLLAKKQNLLHAGDNVHLVQRPDGSYDIWVDNASVFRTVPYLPDEEDAEENVIYFVPNPDQSDPSNLFLEYIYHPDKQEGDRWELIGGAGTITNPLKAELIDEYVEEVPEPSYNNVEVTNLINGTLAKAVTSPKNNITYFCGQSTRLGVWYLDETDGQVKQTNWTTGSIYGYAKDANDDLYFLGNMGILKLNATTGVISSFYSSSEYFYNGILDKSGTLYFTSQIGVFRLNPAATGIVTTNITDGTFQGGALASDGTLYVVGSTGIWRNNGLDIFTQTNITANTTFACLAPNGKLYFSVFGQGIKVLNNSTLNIDDSTQTTGSFGLMEVAPNGVMYVLATAAPQGVWYLDNADETFKQVLTGGNWYGIATTDDGTFYVASGSLYRLNPSTNTFESVGYSGSNISLAATKGRLYIFSNNGGIRYIEDGISGGLYARKYGEWVKLSPKIENIEDILDTIEQDISDTNDRIDNSALPPIGANTYFLCVQAGVPAWVSPMTAYTLSQGTDLVPRTVSAQILKSRFLEKTGYEGNPAVTQYMNTNLITEPNKIFGFMYNGIKYTGITMQQEQNVDENYEFRHFDNLDNCTIEFRGDNLIYAPDGEYIIVFENGNQIFIDQHQFSYNGQVLYDFDIRMSFGPIQISGIGNTIYDIINNTSNIDTVFENDKIIKTLITNKILIGDDKTQTNIVSNGKLRINDIDDVAYLSDLQAKGTARGNLNYNNATLSLTFDGITGKVINRDGTFLGMEFTSTITRNNVHFTRTIESGSGAAAQRLDNQTLGATPVSFPDLTIGANVVVRININIGTALYKIEISSTTDLTSCWGTVEKFTFN